MSSSDRRSLLAGIALLPWLPACGFAPVHGNGGGGGNAAHGLRGRVRVEPIESREGFALVGRLEERLGRPEAGAGFALSVTLETSEEEVALSTTNQIDRFNVIGIARFSLHRSGEDEVLVAGVVDNFTSYSATTGTVGTLSAKRDAFDRLARALADQIVARLMASSSDWNR